MWNGEDNSYLTSAEKTLNGGGGLGLDETTYQFPPGASGSQKPFDGSAFVTGEYHFITLYIG